MSSTAEPTKTSNPPKIAASEGVRRPPGNARLAVRRICASRARSSHWLSAPAPPATIAVPKSVATKVAKRPGWTLPRAPQEEADGHGHQNQQHQPRFGERHVSGYPAAGRGQHVDRRGTGQERLIDRRH